MRMALLLAVLAGCIGSAGDPMLRGAPHPNTGAMAAAAAGVAGAVTLASPQLAAQAQEGKKAYDTPVKPVTVKETVPEGVLDRADQQQQQAPRRDAGRRARGGRLGRAREDDQLVPPTGAVRRLTTAHGRARSRRRP
jgi:hypothetical protein